MTTYIFSQLIINWFHVYGRKNLPWQKNKTLYRVWISEIMLQQTTVHTVIPYFKKFTSKFPHMNALIAGQLDDILYLWSGLGYYSRAFNIYQTAQIIKKKHNSTFPESFQDIIQLPGIGRTTAGAILSLSKNFFFPILEGNVKRIIMRYYGIINNRTKYHIEKKLWKILELITPLHNTNKFNQAMMDIGSIICTPTHPHCKICPLNQKCLAYQEKKWTICRVNQKIKIKKTAWFIVIQHNNHYVWLEKNTQKNIWKNLFCFPSFTNEINALQWLHKKNINAKKYDKIANFIHVFSHFKLHIHAILIPLSHLPNTFYTINGIWYNFKKPSNIGIPSAIQKILDMFT